MPASFLSLMNEVSDPRIAGMITYPMDEILLAALVGVLCGSDDFDDIENIGRELLGWLRGFLPYEHGIAPAQTMRRVFRVVDAAALERLLASWASALLGAAPGVVAIDGKTLRASKQAADRSGRCICCAPMPARRAWSSASAQPKPTATRFRPYRRCWRCWR